MTLHFHPEALAEYQEAAHFYAERQSGLDLRFIKSVEKAIAAILENPTRWRVIQGRVRRCRARVFPYSVLYTAEENEVVIVAVAHASRDTNYWRQRE